MTMLSLPDNWEFSGRGLAAILPDGRDKVFSSLRRLEEHGYLKRNKITLKGKVVDYEYEFCDCPIFPKRESVIKKRKKNPVKANSLSENIRNEMVHVPHPENPDTEKHDNKKQTKQSENKQNKEHTIPSTVPEQSDFSEEETPALRYVPEPTYAEIAAVKNIDELRVIVKKRIIMYNFCVYQLSIPRADVDYVVDVIVEMLFNGKRQWIGGKYIGIRKIRACLCRLNAEKIAIILRNVSRNAKGVRNYKQYLKAALLNSD